MFNLNQSKTSIIQPVKTLSKDSNTISYESLQKRFFDKIYSHSNSIYVFNDYYLIVNI